MQVESLGLGDVAGPAHAGPRGQDLGDDAGQRREDVILARLEDEAVEGDVVLQVGGDAPLLPHAADRGGQL